MDRVDDVKKAAAELVNHFGSSRVDAYFQCFTPEADFIFYSHPKRLTSRKAYEELWKSWESEIDFKVLSCLSTNQSVRLIGEGMAIFTHNVSTNLSTRDGEETVSERETIVFQLIGDRWMAIHEHLSSANS